MDRADALELCRARTLKETTLRHLISVEGVMRSLGRRFGEDEELWAMTGLFHDLDQDVTGDDAQGHAHLAAGWLRDAAVDERIVNGVLAHAHPEYRTDRMSALVRPAGADGMKVSSVKKKLKERAFAPGVNRAEVTSVTEGLGLDLDEFLALSIAGLQSVAPEIGLA